MGRGGLTEMDCPECEMDIPLRMTVVLGASWGDDDAISAC